MKRYHAYSVFQLTMRSMVVMAFYILVSFPSKCLAQLLFNNNVGITMTTGVTMTVKGNVSSNGTTTINNSGTIELTGNWLNNTSAPIFGTSAGTVTFKGTTQDIAGSSQTLFNNLTLSGSPVVTMQLNTSTGGNAGAGVLNVGSGVLDLNANVLNVNNSAVGAITFTTGGIISEEIDNSARVKWNIGTTTGNHIVPFRNISGDLIPVNVELTSGDAGTVDFATYATNAANTPFPSSPEIVTHVKNTAGANNSVNMVDRFWYLQKTGGTGAATLTFTFSPTEVPASGNLGPRAQRWSAPGDGWFAVTPGQNNPTAFTTRVPGISTFGTWALANETTPLPVELLFFDAVLNDSREVDILWVTASEINNDYFTIEKSADGINFFELKKVDGAGNSNYTIEYKEIDAKPFQGISYYRLKQTDFDGTIAYTKIVPVRLDGYHGASVSVYPNPVSDYFYLSLGGEFAGGGKYVFSIYDAAGRLVKNNEIISTDASMSLFKFEKGNISPGIYQYAVVSTDEQIVSGKLVVQ